MLIPGKQTLESLNPRPLESFLPTNLDDAIMTTKLSTVENRRIASQAIFVLFKLPALLITPVLGFIIEFLYELPFMLICLLDSRFRK